MSVRLEAPTRAELHPEIAAVAYDATVLSNWQYVIHGDTGEYRASVVEAMAGEWKVERLRRYALCGRGDIVRWRFAANEEGGGGDYTHWKVQPRGCGERLCPRCSRRAGARAMGIIAERFLEVGHADLYHVVVTQRIRPGEALERTHDRMEQKRRRMQRNLQRLGAVGGVTALHCVWSRQGGWHVHVHMIFEMEERITTEAVFRPFLDDADMTSEAYFMNRCAGPRTAESYKGDGKLFEDTQDDPAGEALGYIHGELLKGIELFKGVGFDGGRLLEYVAWIRGRQLVRRWGAWNKDSERLDAVRKQRLAAESEADRAEFTGEMGVDVLLLASVRGSDVGRAFLRFLLDRYPDGSGAGGRLRFALGPAP